MTATGARIQWWKCPSQSSLMSSVNIVLHCTLSVLFWSLGHLKKMYISILYISVSTLQSYFFSSFYPSTLPLTSSALSTSADFTIFHSSSFLPLLFLLLSPLSINVCLHWDHSWPPLTINLTQIVIAVLIVQCISFLCCMYTNTTDFNLMVNEYISCAVKNMTKYGLLC